MNIVLGFGNQKYPELKAPFSQNPDKSGLEFPDAETLLSYWHTLHNDLDEKISSLTEAQWLEKHTAVKQEDFEKNPARNKLSVLVGRTNHLAYHLGQLNLLNL